MRAACQSFLPLSSDAESYSDALFSGEKIKILRALWASRAGDDEMSERELQLEDAKCSGDPIKIGANHPLYHQYLHPLVSCHSPVD